MDFFKVGPYGPGVFDCIICVDVIEHLVDDTGAIREMGHCLKPGGRLIITAPSRDFPFFYDPVNYVLGKFGKRWPMGIWGWGHQRLYTVREIQRKTGFELVKAAYLSGSLVGIAENSYLSSLLQKFSKSDPYNQDRMDPHASRTEKTVRYKVPEFLCAIRDIIIALDRFVCRASTRSVGIMAVLIK